MAYTYQPHPRFQEVRYNTAAGNRILYTVVDPYTKLETQPSAITITIYGPGGTTAKLDATDMTLVSGSDSQYYYDLDTTTTATWLVDFGYRCDIKYTINSIAYYDQLFLGVVYHPLQFTLRSEDLWELQSELERQLAPGRTGWERKILAAENMIRTEIYETVLQNQNMKPGQVNGYAQLFEWHRYLTLALIFEDIEENPAEESSKASMYRSKANEAKGSVMAVIAYSPSDEESPEGDSETVAGVIYTTR